MEERISVKIGSMSYQITARENEEYMREIARKADDLIRNIKMSNQGMGDSAAAVLALLNVLDACEKLKESGTEVFDEQDRLLRQLEESKADLLRMREQCWEMKKDLLYYRNLCEIYEERLADMPGNARAGVKKSPHQKEQKKPLDSMQTSFADFADKGRKSKE